MKFVVLMKDKPFPGLNINQIKELMPDIIIQKTASSHRKDSL